MARTKSFSPDSILLRFFGCEFKLRFFDIANFRGFPWFAFLKLDHVKKCNVDDDDVYRLYQEPYFPKNCTSQVSQFLRFIQQQYI